jgi:predicted ester cyclase
MGHAETLATSRDAGVVLRSIEIMGTGPLADFEAVIHPEAVNHESGREPSAARVPGPAGFHGAALWLRSAYDGLRFEVLEAVEQGDLVVCDTEMSGRHTGPFVIHDEAGVPEHAFAPTGRDFSVRHTHWFRVRDHQVVDHWANRDDMGQAQQLGWIPPSPAYLFRCARALRRARRET